MRGRIGSNITRRCSAYPLYASGPANIFRLPYMWKRTKKTKNRPVTAMRIFIATVVSRARSRGVTVVEATLRS